MRYQTKVDLWAYPGKGGWHFVTLPSEISSGIKALAGAHASAWGSIRVEAMIGETRWRTSLFPASTPGAFLLPVKAEVRRKEGLNAGDRIEVTVGISL